jgi:type IV pilus assembly protein PilC
MLKDMRYTYAAQKRNGDMYHATIDARDRFELYDTIRKEGGVLINYTEDTSTLARWFQGLNARFSTVPQHEVIMLCRNLGAMIVAGLNLSRSLSVLERQTKNAKLKSVLVDMSAEVKKGSPFYTALAKHPGTFTKLLIAMVKAGEESGSLAQALSVVADQMEQTYLLKKRIRGAMMYPSVVIFAMVCIAYLMMTQVVPTLGATFKEMNAELPAATQAVINLSDLLVNHALETLISVVSVISVLVYFFKTPRGGRILDWTFLHMPIVGNLSREVNSARTMRTLSSLLIAQVDVITALDITKDVVQNSYFKDVLQKAGTLVSKGEPLSSIFVNAGTLYPPLVGEMVSVGEETGKMADMCQRLGIFYEDEVTRKTKDLSTIIEPFLMLFIGAGVGFFAIAMVSPIYSLSEHV